MQAMGLLDDGQCRDEAEVRRVREELVEGYWAQCGG
jgi:hypothetical protein